MVVNADVCARSHVCMCVCVWAFFQLGLRTSWGGGVLLFQASCPPGKLEEREDQTSLKADENKTLFF